MAFKYRPAHHLIAIRARRRNPRSSAGESVGAIGGLALLAGTAYFLFQGAKNGGCGNILYRYNNPTACPQGAATPSPTSSGGSGGITLQQNTGVVPSSGGACNGWTRRLTSAEFAAIGDPNGTGPIQTIQQLFQANGESQAFWQQHGGQC